MKDKQPASRRPFNSQEYIGNFIMDIQKMLRMLSAYLFSFLITVFVVGCGGGSGDQSKDEAVTPSPFSSTYNELTAVPGPMSGIRVGGVATLDGSQSSTTSEEPLSYSWSFSYKPDGSNAVLQGATTATPTFTADVRGVYMVQLLVSAESVSSQRAVAMVVATNESESLIGPFPGHQGISSNCGSCHDGITQNNNGQFLPQKVPNHIATSNMCQACHTPQGYSIIPFVDHQETFGNCSECHNGDIAIGKSETHPATDAECSDCHNTSHFLALGADGSFDHSNIVRSCSGCHNGTIATGKTPGVGDVPPGSHPQTNAECGSCHTTSSFLNAYPDHTAPVVTGVRCDSCHVDNGSGAANGHSPGHPITNVDCNSCHSIQSFKMPGGIFNHALLDATVQSCESCHNDNTSINAPAKSSAVPAHPATTTDCGSCHSTDTFNPPFNIDHTDPAVLAARCDSCHGVSASGKPVSTPVYAHMPTTEDCKVCHTPGSFRTGVFSHSGPSYVGSCNSCHDNVIGVGKLLNHIPTSPDDQNCADCHVTTSFADVTFDHGASDTSNCLTCHDGNISKGKSIGHVTTVENCSSCHTTSTFTTFANTFVHNPAIVSSDCASCHNTGIALPKKPNHIPAKAECSECHIDTTIPGGFAASTFFGNIHPGITNGCEGCHSGQFSTNSNNLYGKPGNHMPTVQDCDVCHTSASFMAPTTFTHAGISDNCTSCHNGDFVGIGARAKSVTHPVTNSDCGSCHAISNNFTDGTFDHTGIVSNCASCHGDTTTATPVGPKKNIGHLPTTQDCSTCHTTGTFVPATFDHTGITDNCTSCHGDGATSAVTKKNPGHVTTSQDCSVCHNTSTFAGAAFDHTGITNNCVSCHDGATARGKTPPPNHLPTTQDCYVCHQTTGFVPGTFDHTGIVDNCRSCHDGAVAIGKSATHVQTNQDCGVCHTTNLPLTFVGGVFDHTGIVNNCESCHDGSTAIGKDAKTNPAHIPTSLDCSSCHVTATFLGASWVHDSSTANNCDSCHVNGGAAKRYKLPGHLSTTEQCDVCHTTQGWTPTDFRHSNLGNYPGDHRRDPGCTGCHKGTIGSGINSGNYPSQLRYAPTCAGCHAGDFERKGDHIGGENGTVEQNKNCAGSGCHRVNSSEF